MKELLGRTIVKIELNDDDTAMIFTDSSGITIAYGTEGDCCSESWFSGINGIQHLIGNPVVSVEEKPEQTVDGTRQDVDVIYGVTIATLAGRCDVAFCNSSNGYYGGWCDVTNYAARDLREISADFGD